MMFWNMSFRFVITIMLICLAVDFAYSGGTDIYVEKLEGQGRVKYTVEDNECYVSWYRYDKESVNVNVVKQETNCRSVLKKKDLLGLLMSKVLSGGAATEIDTIFMGGVKDYEFNKRLACSVPKSDSQGFSGYSKDRVNSYVVKIIRDEGLLESYIQQLGKYGYKVVDIEVDGTYPVSSGKLKYNCSSLDAIDIVVPQVPLVWLTIQQENMDSEEAIGVYHRN